MAVDDINAPDSAHGKWEKFKKAGAAYKSARFYMWIGLISGFALLGLNRLLEHLAERKPVVESAERQAAGGSLDWLLHGLAFIFEHLGIGLIVAAIAIFFYEWGAHIKETIGLSTRLTGAIEQTKHMMEAINMNERLNNLNKGTAEIKLVWCLDTLIGGPARHITAKPEYVRKLIDNCQNLVFSLASLRRQNDWGSEQYLTFISNHIEKVVGHNAEAFSKLYEKTGEQHFMVPPTAAQMADEILAAQMQSLNKGGRYDVISDLPSWQGTQLNHLHKATRCAIEENDVQVRRVFNLMRGTPKGTKEILLRHLEHSQKWRGQTKQAVYEVKILGVGAYKKLKQRGHSLDSIEKAHFGVFINGAEKVRFKVTEPDLSDMELSKDPALVEPSLNMFDAVWRFATDFLPEQKTGEAAREYIDQLLSEIEEWKEKS
ncbi:MAG TPA: hypothetical protein VF791_06700 [Pyrinomonadaceae bacterium]